MANEVDDIGEDVAMWPLMLMRLKGCCDVANEVDEIGGDVVMWPLKLMRLKEMS